jgi:hypothetical protein
MKGGDCDTECASPALLEDPDVAVVMRGSVADLERARHRLIDNGVEAALVRANDEAGAGCCSTTIYLVVARDDAPAAFAVFDADWRRGLSEEQIAALEAAASIEVDPDGAEMTCPACLTTFAAGPSECPDCGLAIV